MIGVDTKGWVGKEGLWAQLNNSGCRLHSIVSVKLYNTIRTNTTEYFKLSKKYSMVRLKTIEYFSFGRVLWFLTTIGRHKVFDSIGLSNNRLPNVFMWTVDTNISAPDYKTRFTGLGLAIKINNNVYVLEFVSKKKKISIVNIHVT